MLRLSPDLTLPVDAVTGTFGILATKGAGKSNAAVVFAEEMYDAGVPWVAIDPARLGDECKASALELEE